LSRPKCGRIKGCLWEHFGATGGRWKHFGATGRNDDVVKRRQSELIISASRLRVRNNCRRGLERGIISMVEIRRRRWMRCQRKGQVLCEQKLTLRNVVQVSQVSCEFVRLVWKIMCSRRYRYLRYQPIALVVDRVCPHRWNALRWCRNAVRWPDRWEGE